MFQMEFLDGSPVDKDYADRIAKLVNSAATAEAHTPVDELEEFANQQREKSGLQCEQEQAFA